MIIIITTISALLNGVKYSYQDYSCPNHDFRNIVKNTEQSQIGLNIRGTFNKVAYFFLHRHLQIQYVIAIHLMG